MKFRIRGQETEPEIELWLEADSDGSFATLWARRGNIETAVLDINENGIKLWGGPAVASLGIRVDDKGAITIF